MSNFKKFAMASAVAGLAVTTANAADLPLASAAPIPVVREFSGWYLRGDIGMTNQSDQLADRLRCRPAPRSAPSF